MVSRRALLCGLAGSLAGLLSCDPGGTECPLPEQDRIDGKCVSLGQVRLNSVGFLPDRKKIASVAGAGERFIVRRADGTVALEGSTSGPLHDPDTGEDLTLADFSALSETGDFYVDVPGVGRSPTFHIAPDVYATALATAMLGLTGQRCGGAVSLTLEGSKYAHGICHGNDARLDFLTGASDIKPSRKGWHDAGDYGKYTVNGAFAAGVVLKAWEHFADKLKGLSFDVPEHGGPLPDLLAEVRWELEWLLTLQAPDGTVAHKVTALHFEALSTAPEADVEARYFAPPGTAATAAFTAVMAQAARIYTVYDGAFSAACLAAAKLSYAYLRATPAQQKPDLSAFTTGEYQTDDADDRLWAAAELWETTGDAEALSDLESHAAGVQIELRWDWSNVGNLGLFTYVLSSRPGKNAAVASAVKASAITIADTIVAGTAQHGYGRAVGAQYYWGINGVEARTCMNLIVAHKLDPKEAYLDAAAQQVDHLFGRNPYGRSMVTGIGHRPPIAPHHRPSVADHKPWPGLLVGGPWPMATSWVDDAMNYKTNEVAINWTAALIYALAAFSP